MNTTLVFTAKQEKLRRRMLNPFFFFIFALLKVPAICLAGVRVKQLNAKECVIAVPYKYLNKNPFKSMYFAVQAMAAEISTALPALLAIEQHHASVALLVVDLQAKFHKKGIDTVIFTCEDYEKLNSEVNKAIHNKEPVTVTTKTIGKMKDGTLVSEFYFTWSFKVRG